MIKACKHCGCEFESGKGNRRYCSDECFAIVRAEQKRDEYERNIETHKKSMKNYYELHKPEFYQATARMRAKYPEKARARNYMSKLVQRKGFKYPEHCENCNSTGIIHAHHPDYNKPKEVKFLCIVCHNDEHRIYNNTKESIHGLNKTIQ
jgi:ABC-type Fe3+-citrate transport system substrate-binding protein